MSVWLFAKSILCRNVRDFVSASGTASINKIGSKELPRIYTNLLDCSYFFKEEIKNTPSIVLKNAWSECGNAIEIPSSANERIVLWLNIVSRQYGGETKKIAGIPYKFRETLEKILDV